MRLETPGAHGKALLYPRSTQKPFDGPVIHMRRPGYYLMGFESISQQLASGHSCFAFTQRNLLTYGTFGMFAEKRVAEFFYENAKLVNSKTFPIYYNDPSPQMERNIRGEKVILQSPFLMYGAEEKIYIFKFVEPVNLDIISKYQ